VVDYTDVAGLTREGGKIIASEVVVVVDHRIGKASDNGFGNIWNTVSISDGIDEEVGIAFVLRLGRTGKAGDKVLIIVRSDRIKTHGSRDIQEDHGVICRYFRSIIGPKRHRYNLLGVAG
jgi:hypothetical protein